MSASSFSIHYSTYFPIILQLPGIKMEGLESWDWLQKMQGLFNEMVELKKNKDLSFTTVLKS